MRLGLEELIPDSTTTDQKALLLKRTATWRSWNLQCLKSLDSITAFLSINEEHCDFLGQQSYDACEQLLRLNYYDKNQVLAFCKSHEMSLTEGLRTLDDQRKKIDTLKAFKRRLDELNGAPYGALYACAPTGVKAMAAALNKIAIITGPQIIDTKGDDHTKINARIIAAEKFLRERAQDHLNNPPTSSIPLTGRSDYVTQLYRDIVTTYKQHAPKEPTRMTLRRR